MARESAIGALLMFLSIAHKPHMENESGRHSLEKRLSNGKELTNPIIEKDVALHVVPY